MKSFLLLALFCGTFHQVYTGTCNECNSDSSTCNTIKDYIKCLTAATGAGCETVHTKMDNANTAAGTNNCHLTDTCQCQVGYFKTDLSAGDAVKCTALKSELKCMFDKSDASCDATINADTAYGTVKTAAEGISKCFTGTACECEATLMKSAKNCDAYKDALTCLFASHVTDASTTPCDGGNFAAFVNATKQSGLAESNCLTSVCDCQASYYSSDLSTNSLKCNALKSELKCMFGKTDASCDANINADTAYGTVKTAAEGISKCFTGTACECEATLMKSAKDCDAYKKALTCLFASHVTDATTTPCDGGNFAAFVNATKQLGLDQVNCLNNSVCDCQASYYSSDLSTNSLKCKAVTDFETCTVNKPASEMSCDGMNNLIIVQNFMNAVKDAACDGARVNHVPVLVAVVMLMSWTLK